MILYPPVKFDENELFILITIAIAWFLMFRLLKHLTPLDVVLLWTLNVSLAVLADFTIGVPPYDFYDTTDSSKFNLFDMITYFLSYPPFAYLALNYYKSCSLSGMKPLLFILVCTLLTTSFEWLAHLFHVYTYKGRKIYFSFVSYVITYALNILLITFIKRKVST